MERGSILPALQPRMYNEELIRVHFLLLMDLVGQPTIYDEVFY